VTQAVHETILILDFGSQYTQLIARRVRELGVYNEVRPFDDASLLFRGLEPSQPVWASHGDRVLEAAPGFAATASNPDNPLAAVENSSSKRYGSAAPRPGRSSELHPGRQRRAAQERGGPDHR